MARQLRRSPRLVAGLLMIGAAGAAALAGLVVAGDPFAPSQAILSSPSAAHPLGTDELGRDVLDRLLHGAGTSLLVAVVGVLPATVFGTLMGLVAGYAGRSLDEVILKATELFQIMPAFLLALVAGALFGPSLLLLIVVLNLIFWPFTARLARGEAAALREREFVEAARALGAGRLRILRRHVLPGVLPPVIVNASFQAGVAMLIEAGLAFLGLGDANVVSWGQMLAAAQEYLGVAWWLYVLPGAALAFTVLGMNLAGDGLNQLRGRPHAAGVRAVKRGRTAPARRAHTPRPDAGDQVGASGQDLLHVRGLTTRFGPHAGAGNAVAGVDLRVRAGQRIAIVGESGAGKTVMAQSIMGLLDPPGTVVTGEIWLNGQNLCGLSEREYRRVRGSQVAMIFQDPLSSLNPVIRVGDQLARTIAMHRKVGVRESRELAVARLREVGIPAARERLDAYPHELSGGMRQRVGIALALCCEPDLLIADEPTSALDVTIQAQILELLKKLVADHGTALILITHDLAVVAGFAEEVSVMCAGRVVEHADVDTLFSRPAHSYTRSLLSSVSRLDRPRAHQRRGVEGDREVTSVRSAATARIPGEDVVPGRRELLRVTGLSKHFPVTEGRIRRHEAGRVHAVDGISLVVYERETLGVVGESGCGKSTAVRTMLRLVEPTGGHVICLGHDVGRAGREELRALRRDMQVVFQDPLASLNPRLPVREIVGEPLEIHRLPGDDGRIGRLLEQVGLPRGYAGRLPHELSGGERQRVVIARALATRPKLIFCDEPVSALDVSIRGQILDLLGALQDELGLSYVIVSHDLSMMRNVADKVAVMYLGKIVELAQTDHLYDAPRHPYAVALMSAIPIPDPPRERARRPRILAGELPSPARPPPGCRFHTRCWKAQKVCRIDEPPLAELAPGHWVACHFPVERQTDDSSRVTR